MKIFLVKSLLTLSAAGIVITSGTAQAQTQRADIKIPKTVIAGAMNTALSGTRIHVDNLGSKRNGKSWLEQHSYVLLPNGQRRSFAVPDYEYKVTSAGRTLVYYVRDFNSSAMNAYVDGNRLRIVLQFESQGQEIAAKCVRRRGIGNKRHWSECSLGMERDIHLNNARTELSVVPVAYKGSISYGAPQADVKGDIKIANRMCGIAKGICGYIEGKIRSNLYPTIRNAAVSNLNSEAMRTLVATRIRSALRNRIKPNWKVVNIRSQGSNFVVTVERPAPRRTGG